MSADELGGLRDVGRVPHLVVGSVLFAVADVVGDRAGEQHGLLRDEADLARSSACGISRTSTPSTSTRPLVHVVEARDQVDQRGLARAGAADDGRDLARGGRGTRCRESAGSSAPGYWKVTLSNST